MRQRLLTDAAGGDFDALDALGDVRTLPEPVVRDLVQALSKHVRGQIQAAAQGSFAGYPHDHGHALALLNTWHPELASWDPLLELIADPYVLTTSKRGAIRHLADAATRVPAGCRTALLTAARTAAAEPPHTFAGLFGENKDCAGPAAELVAALASEDSPADPDQLPALLTGNADARRSAARIATRLHRPEDIGVLLVLATDQDPGARMAAAFGLAMLVAAGEGGTTVLAAVRRAADDPGRLVPRAIAAALNREPPVGADARALLDVLRGHGSAMVRQAAASPATP